MSERGRCSVSVCVMTELVRSSGDEAVEHEGPGEVHEHCQRVRDDQAGPPERSVWPTVLSL